MDKIVVIGTQPPCPRCKLLTELVTRMSKKKGLDAEISHIAYTCDEAVEYARRFGLEPGTAKDVAKKAGLEIDWEDRFDVPQNLTDQIENLEEGLKDLEGLFKEVAILDTRLRSFEYMAKDQGFLMTPVLIVNDEIKYSGSLPMAADIEGWLGEMDKGE